MERAGRGGGGRAGARDAERGEGGARQPRRGRRAAPGRRVRAVLWFERAGERHEKKGDGTRSGRSGKRKKRREREEEVVDRRPVVRGAERDGMERPAARAAEEERKAGREDGRGGRSEWASRTRERRAWRAAEALRRPSLGARGGEEKKKSGGAGGPAGRDGGATKAASGSPSREEGEMWVSRECGKVRRRVQSSQSSRRRSEARCRSRAENGKRGRGRASRSGRRSRSRGGRASVEAKGSKAGEGHWRLREGGTIL